MQTATSSRKINPWILTTFAVLALLWPWSGKKASAAAPPPNDDFDSAIIITPPLPYFHSQLTTGATPASLNDKTTPGSPGYDEPQPTCISNTRGFNIVWYRFTPTVSGLMTFETFGSDYDTVLNIWTGERGSLTSVRCNDDGGYDYDSRLQIPVVAGTTYHIQIAGFAVTDFGTLVLKVSWFGKTSPDRDSTDVYPSPSLRWSPAPEITDYEYCVDEIDNGRCDTAFTSVGINTSVTVKLKLNATYYWQVRGTVGIDKIPADSDVWWSFETATSYRAFLPSIMKH